MLASLLHGLQTHWTQLRTLSIALAWSLLLLLGVNSLSLQPILVQPALAQAMPDATPASQTAAVRLSMQLTIVAIDAEISKSAQTTQVSLRSIGSSLEELGFQFPVIEFTAIEQAIADELNLPTSTIHRLIRYRIND